MLQFTEFKSELVNQISNKVGELGLANIEISTKFEATPSGLQERLNLKRIGSNAGLSIRLEEVYHDYTKGRSLEEITEMLGNSIEGQLKEADAVADISKNITDYEWVKERMTLFAMPYYSDTKKDYVTFRVGCIEVGVRVCVQETEKTIGSFGVTNDVLKAIGVSKEQLIEDARANSQAKRKIEFRKLSEAAGDKEAEDLPAYIASIDRSVGGMGGGIIAYDNFVPEVQKLLDNDSFYIVPSSINELIIFPKEVGQSDPRGLNLMLMFSNETVIRREEVLAQNVMFYNGEAEELEIVEFELED